MANDRHLLCFLMMLSKHRLPFNRIQAIPNGNIQDFCSILSVKERMLLVGRNAIYLLVAPIRRTRPTTTTTEEPVTSTVEPKTAALLYEKHKKSSNIGLILLVVLLSTLLVLLLSGFLLYKR